MLMAALVRNVRFSFSTESAQGTYGNIFIRARSRTWRMTGMERPEGLTVHCNDDPPVVTGPQLQSHCERRKYTEKAQTWFSLCMSPNGPTLRFGINLDFAWAQSDMMDAATRGLKPAVPVAEALGSLRRREKVGRNDRCPCGSGLKHKKCCLLKGGYRSYC